MHALTGVQKNCCSSRPPGSLGSFFSSLTLREFPPPQKSSPTRQDAHTERGERERQAEMHWRCEGVCFSAPSCSYYLCLGLLAILALVTEGKAKSRWAGGGGEGFMLLEEVLGVSCRLRGAPPPQSSQERERGGGNRLR